MPCILGFSTVKNNASDSGINCSYFSACCFFPFNQNIISVKQFRSLSCPSGLICVQNCLQKDKNLIGIQSVKHSLDQDLAGHYVGLDLGLNFLLKKKLF